MDITFVPLNSSDFPILLKWLETAHVKKWWDQDIVYTLELVAEKFGDYVKGYKSVEGVNKGTEAYIIYLGKHPIGYLQLYNAYDFLSSKSIISLPKSLGGIDIFIGEEKYLRQGIGFQAILKFLREYVKKYSHIFVDPALDNIAAIKTYEKAGFKKIQEQLYPNELWMIWKREVNER